MLAFSQLIDDSEQACVGFRSEDVVEQFSNIFLVNVSLLFVVRNDDLQSSRRKYFLLEAARYGKARTKQPNAFQSEAVCFVARRFDNAEQRNPGTFGEFIKDDMRRVCRQHGEVSTGAREPFNFDHQFVGECAKFIGGGKSDVFVNVDAVNDDRRIAAVRFLLAVGRDDVTIVFDR